MSDLFGFYFLSYTSTDSVPDLAWEQQLAWRWTEHALLQVLSPARLEDLVILVFTQTLSLLEFPSFG